MNSSDFEKKLYKKFGWRCYPRADLEKLDPEKYFPEYHYVEELKADETKFEDDKYTSGYFQQDFGKGMQKYHWGLYVVSDYKDRFPSRFFAAARSEITEEEQKKLEPYCPCRWHKPPKWFIYVKILSFVFILFFGFVCIGNIIDWQLYSKEFDGPVFASIILLSLFSVAVYKFGWSVVYAIPQAYLFCPCCYGCVASPFPQQWTINGAREKYQQSVEDEIKSEAKTSTSKEE